MSLPSRLLGANPSIQVSTLLSGSLTTPSAKGAFAPGDFESIATVSVGSGGVTNIEFTSIPSSYSHLQVRTIGRSTRTATSAYINMQFNSDTGSNYSYHDLYGDGSAPAAGALTSQTAIYLQRFTAASAGANTFGSLIVDILDYKDTNKYKTIRSLGGNDRNGSGQMFVTSGLWLSTNAITSIKFTSEATGNFAQYTHFALYGIRGV